MDIMTEIKQCAIQYEMSTGLKPKYVYIGRSEMDSIAAWMVANNLADPPLELGWGVTPKLHGLTTYVVDDHEPHIRCCV